MEKAKSFKWTNMFYLLLILPLMFVFAACGGDPATEQLKTKATCDTSGDYAASSVETYEQKMETATFDAKGYRLTIEISMSTTQNEVTTTAEILYANAIMKEIQKDEAVDLEMALQVKMDLGPLLGALVPESEDDSMDVVMFYKDGKAYGTDEKGNKVYSEVPAAYIEYMFSGYGRLPAFDDVDSVLNIVEEVKDNVTVTQNGNNFKIVTNSAELIDGQQIAAGATVYVNCDSNGKIVAAQLGFEMGTAAQKVIYKTTISAFGGNIAFPDLTKYQPAEEDPAID